jgi:hypothetical protein
MVRRHLNPTALGTDDIATSGQLLAPLGPIYLRRIDNFQVGGCELIGEEDQVVARPAGVGRDDTVETQKRGRVADCLRGSVENLTLSIGIDA